MAASFSGGGGYPSITPSNVIRGKIRRDPNWELQSTSEEQTSVYTESIPYRTLTAIGYIKPTRVGEATTTKFWTREGEDVGEVALDFYFEGFELQNCYGIQVKSISVETFGGALSNVAVRSTPTDGELCGDVIDDEIAGSVSYYNFSGDRNNKLILRDRHQNNIHEITFFDRNGHENGYYTFEEILTKVKTKIKAYMDGHFSPYTMNVEIFVHTDGRIVLAWSGANIFAATGGFDIDMNESNSTILKIFNRFFIFEKFKRNTYTYGTVSNGDGASFIRRAVRAVKEGDSTIGNVNTLAVLVSNELSQFQKNPSITPISSNAEIASFYLVESKSSSAGAGDDPLYITWFASEATGTLVAPKIDFDPTHTLTSFKASIYLADINGFLKEAIGIIGGVNDVKDDAEKRMHCVITALIW